MEVPKVKQLARATLTLLALGNTLMRLPDNFEGTKKMQAALDRTFKWHQLAQDLCPMTKLSDFSAGALLRKLEIFDKRCKGRPIAVAMWVSSLLVIDVLATCELFRIQPWRRLEAAVDALGRCFLAREKGADFEADRIYLEVCW